MTWRRRPMVPRWCQLHGHRPTGESAGESEQNLQRELWRAAAFGEIDGEVKVDVVTTGEQRDARSVVAGSFEHLEAPALDSLLLGLGVGDVCGGHLGLQRPAQAPIPAFTKT